MFPIKVFDCLVKKFYSYDSRLKGKRNNCFCLKVVPNFPSFRGNENIGNYSSKYIDRQTDRQTDIQTDRHTARQTYRQTDIHTDRHTDRQMYRHTDIQ